jgi:hypothetical protein
VAELSLIVSIARGHQMPSKEFKLSSTIHSKDSNVSSAFDLQMLPSGIRTASYHHRPSSSVMEGNYVGRPAYLGVGRLFSTDILRPKAGDHTTAEIKWPCPSINKCQALLLVSLLFPCPVRRQGHFIPWLRLAVGLLMGTV